MGTELIPCAFWEHLKLILTNKQLTDHPAEHTLRIEGSGGKGDKMMRLGEARADRLCRSSATILSSE